MAEVIDFNGQKYIDAAAVSGIKGILASSVNIDNLRTLDDSGVWYCSNREDTPSPYGILVVSCAYVTGTPAYQQFISATNRVYVRYFGNNAWSNWFTLLQWDTDISTDGRMRRVNSDSEAHPVMDFGANVFFNAAMVEGIKGSIASGDLNDYQGKDKAGMYYLSGGAAAYTNSPTGYAWLTVYCNGTSTGQMIVRRSGIWFRDYTTTALWSDWQKVMYAPSSVDLPPFRSQGVWDGTSIKHIDFGENIMIGAESVGGIKQTITEAGVIAGLNKAYQTGLYYCANVSDAPSAYGMLLVMAASTGAAAAYQMFIPSGVSTIYIRYRSSNQWGSWYKFEGLVHDPDGISLSTPLIHSFSVAHGATKRILFSSGAMGEIATISGYSDTRGMWLFYSESTGNVRTTIAGTAPTGITLATSTNGLSITNNAETNASIVVKVMLMSGSISSVT